MDKGNAAMADIKASNPSASLSVLQLDLNSLASVVKAAADFHALNVPLNILINNAGIMALENFETTADG